MPKNGAPKRRPGKNANRRPGKTAGRPMKPGRPTNPGPRANPPPKLALRKPPPPKPPPKLAARKPPPPKPPPKLAPRKPPPPKPPPPNRAWAGAAINAAPITVAAARQVSFLQIMVVLPLDSSHHLASVHYPRLGRRNRVGPKSNATGLQDWTPCPVQA